MNTKRPTVVFFLGPTKPLQSPIIWIGKPAPAKTVLAIRRDITGKTRTLSWVAGGKRGKGEENKIKAVNRGDKRTRRVRDRDFVKFE